MKDNVCQMCDFRCLECYGYLNSECTKCHSYFIKYSDYCLTDCSNGFFPLPGQTKVCGQCFTGCKECTSTAQSACQSCLKNFYYKASATTCVAACDIGFFGDNVRITIKPFK